MKDNQSSDDRVITVSNSEVETYRQCRLKHQLTYIERWRTDEEHPALSRGTRFHSVMEDHYRAIKGWRDQGDAWDIAKKAPEEAATALYAAVSHHLFDRESGEQTEEMELVEWIYRGYVDLYGLDPSWEIVDVEKSLEIEIAPGVQLKGTVDLIVVDHSAGGGLWIVDHKTCKNLPKKDFDLEDQTAIYTYLLRHGYGMDIRGAIYNHCRTWKLKREMMMDERFKRSITVRTNQELETCVQEAADLMREAYGSKAAERSEYNLACRRHPDEETGKELILPDVDAPRSPNGETCDWKCNLTEACLAGRKRGPAATRQFLEDTGFVIHETKPGPTFNKV